MVLRGTDSRHRQQIIKGGDVDKRKSTANEGGAGHNNITMADHFEIIQIWFTLGRKLRGVLHWS